MYLLKYNLLRVLEKKNNILVCPVDISYRQVSYISHTLVVN